MGHGDLLPGGKDLHEVNTGRHLRACVMGSQQFSSLVSSGSGGRERNFVLGDTFLDGAAPASIMAIPTSPACRAILSSSCDLIIRISETIGVRSR